MPVAAASSTRLPVALNVPPAERGMAIRTAGMVAVAGSAARALGSAVAVNVIGPTGSAASLRVTVAVGSRT